MVGVSKGMLAVRHLAKKILIVVNYYGRQLAHRKHHILERASLGHSMMVGQMGAFGCRLECGI